MENLLTTVFSVVALAALAYRAAAQVRKTGEATKETPVPREAWTSVPAPRTKTAPKPSRAQEFSAEKHTSQNTPRELFQAPAQGSAPKIFPAAASSAQVAPKANTSRTDSNKLHTETFDLRAAIIYSEILKPKFDE